MCVAPWHVLNIENRGNFNICCHIDQGATANPVTTVTAEQWASGPQMTEIREKFLRGEMPEVCHRCSKEESSGKFSLRNRLNNQFWDKDFEYRADNYAMRKLQIDLGNLCNYRCVSCRPYQSTQIVKDYKKIGWVGKDYPKYLANDRAQAKDFEFGFEDYYTDPRAVENFKDITQGLKVIALLGGEPMIIPDTITYLKAISDQTAQDCAISFNTNCSVFNEEVIAETNRFARVIITVSVDGLGDTFDYIRRNGHWAEVCTNIDRFYDLLIKDPHRYIINAIVTTSVYNILSVTDTVKYLMHRYPAMKVGLQRVISPDFMMPANVPDDIKTQALGLLTEFFQNDIKRPYDHCVWLRTETRSLIRALQDHNFDSQLWSNFIDYTNKLDSVRPLPHFLDINPQFKDYWHG